ncbi:Dyp-type peroxidase [Pseudonocardia abyssalis]|uniref:Peroxidase n=1 Tax=Pseudonocardia abyssalis TaxID=2792008 RepID=A0ABS6UM44_9PSEU|nr:peroxidase [Pseudonocardia abyssalis]MBW0115177.1 peroxidase [Pseudonocardia abyssalis]MBW0133001.1 peroxidase [Pseudonocardia abyssalis]
MPLALNRSLSWTSATGADRTLLDELQPNILRPHVREHLTILLLRFDDRVTAAAFLGPLVTLMKSTRTHLEEVEAFRADGTPGSPYVGVGLTAGGYALLDVPEAARPADARFRAGMKASRGALHDPPVAVWEPPYREDVHAVVLVGDATDAAMSTRLNEVLDLVPDSGVTVVGQETGRGQHNAAGDGIEHFGYVDGRSQPLFLDEDVAKEGDGTVGATVWDPRFTLDRVLVPDTAAPDPGLHHGSYLVLRKLEQDVRRFKEAEQALADELGLVGEDRERAGAMIVGRFEDGTPVTTDREAGAPLPVTNNFRYDTDDRGARCPFQGHIRKTNPRGTGGFEQPQDERQHIMARRGQTYGERLDDPGGDVPPSARPTGGVGLLFMAFNVDIADQFEFTQRSWANNPGFPKVPGDRFAPGLDLVIGQGRRPEAGWGPVWGADGQAAADPAAQAVTLRGGEYFFMPSLAFLRGLS